MAGNSFVAPTLAENTHVFHPSLGLALYVGFSPIVSSCIHTGVNRKELSAEQIAELARLAALPDDEIDTKDIPEAPAENWIHAERAADSDHRTEINRVLRRHVAETEKRRV
jgi:hypothetical protein